MALLPSGLVVPDLPYLIAIVIAAATVAAFLVSLQPRVEQRHVFAFTPWMCAGASAHVFYQIDPAVDVYPTWAEPLFAAPAVYVTTFIAMGSIWTLLAFASNVSAGEDDSVAQYLGIVGTVALLGLFGFAAWRDALAGAEPLYSGVAIAVSAGLTVVLYFAMAYVFSSVVARAKLLGALVLFAHLLDGVTTAVGVDVVGTGERSPLPRTIMDLAARLPTAETLGVGWLFVLVKLAVAIGVVVVFADYLEEKPAQGNLAFAIVVALGLGPAVNNLVLFTLRENAAAAAIVG